MNKKVTYYGFNPPFYGGQEGVLSRQEDDRLIKNDILQLLLTIPGERVMRPDFGVNLRNRVFDTVSEPVVERLRNEIVNAIERYDTRVFVSNITVLPNIDNQSLSIKLILRIRTDPKRTLVIDQLIKGTV